MLDILREVWNVIKPNSIELNQLIHAAAKFLQPKFEIHLRKKKKHRAPNNTPRCILKHREKYTKLMRAEKSILM